MFDASELGRKVSKQDYKAALPELRAGLLEAQRALRTAGVPVIVVVSGADGAGKGETVKRLHEWLDPRGLETHVFGPLSDEEQDRPDYWRFWRTLPERGRIGIFFGSWYTDPIIRRVYGKLKRARFDAALDRIAFFEKLLADDGALIVKFWLHLSKKAQKKRLKGLESDRETRWRVTPLDWKHFEMYDDFVAVCERALRRSDAAHAPWHVVEAADDRYRELTVGRTLLDAVKARLARPEPEKNAPAPPPLVPAPKTSVLSRVDLRRKLTQAAYDRRLVKAQARLARLARRAHDKRVSSVVVFEGWDAAGKGGAIRRLVEPIDARLYQVIPIAAPSDEERAHHYLWRFWRHIPRAGTMTLYDRSWYGRVLVERVEGFAREVEWKRSFLEINDFEEQLAEAGQVVTKFWIHLSEEEQLRRFKDRAQTAYKQHKITDEDWRNRERWKAYEAAVHEMLERTSTSVAPWVLIAGNDKRFARVQIVETFADRLEQAL